MMIFRLVLYVCILFGFMPLWGDVYIHHQVTPNIGTIGDPLAYSIVATQNSSFELIPPNEEHLDPFIMKSPPIHFPDVVNGITTYKVDYDLALFQIGEVWIPTQNITIIQNQQSRIHQLPPIKITIQSILPEEKDNLDIRDLKDLIKISLNILPWIIGGLICLALISLGYYLFLKHRKSKLGADPFCEVAFQTPRDMAISELEKLEKQQLIQQKKVKKHYYILTDIMKRYLSTIFQAKISEMTTDEMLETLMSVEMDKETLKRVQFLFEAMDPVKFAKKVPDINTHEKDWNRALNIINRITPPPIANQEGKDA
ncbi:MAG: hypothetical protein HRT90_07145 [Candidatus Margulisbacteria bacterium]|nr:hypothetical protein [Candidatus Margulisiibacteriota bacterium]